MKKGQSPRYRLPKVCTKCGCDYLARQAASKVCEECRMQLKIKILCKCGCGRLCKSGYFSASCKHRGKTYEEIYGKDRSLIKNGFKKGLLNPNYTTEKFQRFRLKHPDQDGELFRSTKEAQFSNLCKNNNLSYEYEVRVPLINGKIKVVDFVVEGSVFVEITGYAYDAWQKAFDTKFQILRKSIPNATILVLSYSDKLSLVRDRNCSTDVFFESIDEEKRILEKIKMFRVMTLTNQFLLSCGPFPNSSTFAMGTEFITKNLMKYSR